MSGRAEPTNQVADGRERCEIYTLSTPILNMRAGAHTSFAFPVQPLLLDRSHGDVGGVLLSVWSARLSQTLQRFRFSGSFRRRGVLIHGLLGQLFGLGDDHNARCTVFCRQRLVFIDLFVGLYALPFQLFLLLT